tara:strand:+ start:320 stop:529 length:210 start_codon:yes stop_codon:yes gene_type:complete
MAKININGTVRDMTSAEETEHTEARLAIATAHKIRTDALKVKKTNKTSGTNKLKALGLTDAEIKALMGA